MLARRMLTISLALTAVSGYLIFFEDFDRLFWLLAIALIGAMLSYVFQHQLNWWWYQRYPPALPEEIEKMFLRSAPFYRSLDDKDRQKFKTRTRMFVEAKEFIAQGFEDVAEEVKYMIAYYAITVSFHQDDYLFKPYDRIVIYLHPFLSPHLPEKIHAYEIEHTDGTLIFSLEQLTAGFLRPDKFYQIGYHVFGEIFATQHSQHTSSEGDSDVWKSLEACGGWSRDDIEDFTGMTQSDPLPVLIHHWFARRVELETTQPQLFRRAAQLLS